MRAKPAPEKNNNSYIYPVIIKKVRGFYYAQSEY